MLKWVALALVVGLGIGVGTAVLVSWNARSEAWKKLATVEAAAEPSVRAFDASMLDGLPEIARRYFLHAIAPGTLLRTTVRLRMQGEFLLGDVDEFQTYAMSAEQVLAPPDQFVWIPTMRSGLLEISGSDALVAGEAWTRFWMNGVLPVANVKGTPDLVRSALSRSAMEAIWAPASLLPENGVEWQQTGPDVARVSFRTGIEPVDMLLGSDGAVLQVVTMRWSDANAQSRFLLQSFGGTIEEERTFEGFTIPAKVSIGNHFGTEDYLPFFQAELIGATFLPK